MTEARVLMFSPAFPPLGNPEAIVNGKLALAFLGAGWQVDVVARDLAGETDYDYGTAWREPWLALRERTRFVRYPVRGILARVGDTLRGAARMGHFIHGCRWAAHACDLGIALHRVAGYDFVISRAGPESAHLAAMAFSRRTGVPWVANWNDPIRQKMPAPYGGGAGGKLARSYQRFFRSVTRAADCHVFPSERQRRYMLQYLGEMTSGRSAVVPHVALALPEAAPPQGDSFVLCHAGRLTPERDPGPFLRGVRLFLERSGATRRTVLKFVGLDDVDLERRVREDGLEAVIELLGPMSYLETLETIAAGDVAVVIEAPCAEGIFLPSKVVDYAQTARPILAVSPRLGTVADLLGAHGGGLAVDCLSMESVAAGIGDLFSAWEGGYLQQRYGSPALARVFSPGRIVALYGEIVAELVGRGVPG